MTTLTTLYKDITLLLDMVDARIKQLQELYETTKKVRATAPDTTDIVEPKDSESVSDDVEPIRKTKKKAVVRAITTTARFVALPSGNFLVFN